VSANTVDVLIFIPLIPAIPVITTWFLPWERWIPRKIPKNIIGPYLLYCSFAIWHFNQSRWFVALVALWGLGVSVVGVVEMQKSRHMKQSSKWPVAEGCVLHTGQNRDENGFLNVMLTYTYKVHDERYGGSESFAFPNDDDATRFETGCKDRALKVRYRQDKPEVSVLDREGMP
jgi:uncharacterized protein DUF3592